ncbi:MAG: glycosyltransferase family 4 protein [Pirellulaceae bacterium]|nr:glycosyltransferase family 4 protein [Pirellulaceae bacterium]
MRIAHLITRMIVGGAQENTLLNCRDLIHEYNDDLLLVTGPAIGPEGDLHAQIEKEGIPTEIISSLRRNIDPRHDFRAYFAIKKTLKDFRPDVVHTHSAKAGLLGRLAASRLKIPAIIHTVHGAPFHPYQGRGAFHFFRLLEQWGAKNCHHLISVANAMTDLLVDNGVAPREKFSTIYSGMKIEPFLKANNDRQTTRKELGFSDDHFVVGKIARLFHLKGHKYLINCAAQIIQEVPNIRFLLVGDGLLREEFEKQIASLNMEKHFCFTGLVRPSQIPRYLGAMDCLVHTSLREGLARTLPQALLAAKPVVSFAIDGAPEVVLPEKTGFLVNPKDEQGLGQAIKTLAQNPKLCLEYGQAGRALCEKRFCHRHMSDEIRTLYTTILSKNSKESP